MIPSCVKEQSLLSLLITVNLVFVSFTPSPAQGCGSWEGPENALALSLKPVELPALFHFMYHKHCSSWKALFSWPPNTYPWLSCHLLLGSFLGFFAPACLFCLPVLQRHFFCPPDWFHKSKSFNFHLNDNESQGIFSECNTFSPNISCYCYV